MLSIACIANLILGLRSRSWLIASFGHETYRVGSNARTVSVRVTLNYQAIPPSYLRDRFTIGKGVETQRLAYLTSHLNVEKTPIDGWKLAIVSATRRLGEK